MTCQRTDAHALGDCVNYPEPCSGCGWYPGQNEPAFDDHAYDCPKPEPTWGDRLRDGTACAGIVGQSPNSTHCSRERGHEGAHR